MDDQERDRLTRRHRELLEQARNAIDEAHRVREEIKPVSAAARFRSLWLSDQARTLISDMQDLRMWSQHTRATTRKAVEASRTLPPRRGKP